MKRYTRVCKSAQEYAEVHKNMQRYTRVCKSAQAEALTWKGVDKSVLLFVDIFQSTNISVRICLVDQQPLKGMGEVMGEEVM